MQVKYVFANKAACRQAEQPGSFLKLLQFHFEEVEGVSQRQDEVCPSSPMCLGKVAVKGLLVQELGLCCCTIVATLW